jgi:CubicO group peptidase (beta-lactamase class C family)
MRMRFGAASASFLLLVAVSVVNAQEYPSEKGWEFAEHPLQKGWDQAKLDKLHKFIRDSTAITSFMIVQRGKIVFDYGDLEENSYIASVRKSILAMLYGEHIKSGEIDLHKTLKELGISDVGGLLPVEEEATVRDIISARSGVFHEASYPGDYLEFAPKRGSVKPGEYWLYSNWDFNVAGFIFEQQTHRNIYDEVERVLAKPLGMEDWNRSLQHKDGDSTKSRYLAYPMWFSARDMARIGVLMLNKGRWRNQQVVAEDWVNEIIKPRTDWTEVNKNCPCYRGSDYYFGYGYLWWLWQNVKDERFAQAYSALGSMGQSISVFPVIDGVVVYKTKDTYERDTPYPARFRVLRLAVQAYGNK